MRRVRMTLTILALIGLAAFALLPAQGHGQSQQPNTQSEQGPDESPGLRANQLGANQLGLNQLRATQLEQQSQAARARRDALAAQSDATAQARDALQNQLVQLGQRAAQLEREVEASELALAHTQSQAAKTREALSEHTASLEAVTGALVRRNQANRSALLTVSPGNAATAARASLALTGVTRAIDARANALRVRAAELNRQTTLMAEQQAQLSQARNQLAQQREIVLAGIAEKQRLEEELNQQANHWRSQAAQLADQAQSLRELIEVMEREERERAAAQKKAQAQMQAQMQVEAQMQVQNRNPAPTQPQTQTPPQRATPPNRAAPSNTAVPPNATIPKTTPRSDAAANQPPPRVRLRPGPNQRRNATPPTLRRAASTNEAFSALTARPVNGQLAYGFGQNQDGQAMDGMGVRTRPRAQVIAPGAGLVKYAGPLHGYDHVLIIAVAKGYYVIFAGLGGVYVQKGQWVVTGEPVGETPRRGRPAQPLHVELRTPHGPVDPQHWLGDRRYLASREKPA